MVVDVIAGELPRWLFADVPLWAFLVALLTEPAYWSDRIYKRLNGQHRSESE